jgi:hypothetical protein
MPFSPFIALFLLYRVLVSNAASEIPFLKAARHYLAGLLSNVNGKSKIRSDHASGRAASSTKASLYLREAPPPKAATKRIVHGETFVRQLASGRRLPWLIVFEPFRLRNGVDVFRGLRGGPLTRGYYL